MFLISDYYKRKEIATWHYSQFVIFLAILDNDSQFREGSSYIETLQLQYEIKGKKNRQCVLKRTTGAMIPALVPIIAHFQQPARKKETRVI